MFLSRIARRDDYAVFARLWDELGIDQPVFDTDFWDDKYREHTLVLEDGGEVVAYALTVPFGARGDVRQIVVDPAWRGRGVGRALMAAAATRLRAEGCTNWRLEVRSDNDAAIRLYRSVGMDVLHELFTLRMTRAAAEAFAATRSGRLHVELVEPHDDAALEARFDLGAGQLARWRVARRAGVMWRIGHDAVAHYTRAFAPDFGLLFPLRAADTDHAAHLVAAACDIGIDRAIETMLPDRAVVAALREAGAAQNEHLYEMGGPL